MRKFTRPIFARLSARPPSRKAASGRPKARIGFLTILAVMLALFIIVPTSFLASKTPQKGGSVSPGGAGKGGNVGSTPLSLQAVNFTETAPLMNIKPSPLTAEEIEHFRQKRERQEAEKNPSNRKRVRPAIDEKKTGAFRDPAINNAKHAARELDVATSPIQNFDGPDADTGQPLYGTRFAPPDTNAAVGPNHVVISTNMGTRVYDKAGNPLTAQFLMSDLFPAIPNATRDDGDPIVLYDQLADRWLITQFNTFFDASNRMHQHIAISKTGDPTGAYFAYDFPLAPGRFVDYPHFGVWPDAYYMASNDFTAPGVNPFLGAGFYAFERDKLLAGDPTAKVVIINSATNNDGGFLPTNLQGYTTPPVGTPNLFIEFFADEFGAGSDFLRAFEFRPNFTTPASSTLTQLTDIPVAAFDARSNFVQQPGGGQNLDEIADRLMHPLNFRVLAGGVQSYVLNFTVNVSGVNPTSSTTYQAGVRWTELRRNAGTGAITINQQATYAPGSGSGTGRDLWMASVAQDGEGNIALAANASAPGPTPAALNPTAIYTGRLASDPPNTLPQGEVDALSAVTRGVQTNTANRWGDYSSLFVDPADECTFWGAFEYVDSPTATFDWNTRIFSFKVNPTCVTPPRGTFSGTITNCANGQPIQDAIVETPDGFFRATIANGTYSAITAAPGTYTVNVSKPGFLPATAMVTVSDGGNAVLNVCLQPTAIIASAGATIVAESCTPPNGALDPNETVTLSFCVQNTGQSNTTNLVGTLQATGGVTAPSGPQNYGVVVASGTPVCRDFTFTVDPMLACGGTVTATLQLQDGATNLGTVTYTFTLGVAGSPMTISYAGSAVPIPDGTGLTGAQPGLPAIANLAVAGLIGSIADIDVRIEGSSCNTTTGSTTVGIDHTFVNDLRIRLRSPSGTVVELIVNTDGSGNNICQTLLDDESAGASIQTVVTAQAPFSGSFKPANPLSAFDGQIPNGTWQLEAQDYFGGDTGNIRAFSLIITTYTCSTTCVGSCELTCPANITQSNDPDQCGAVVNYPPPTTTGTCGTVTCSPASGSFFPVGTTTVTCTATGDDCTFTITVVDTQPPSISCPANVTAVGTPGVPTVVVNYPPPTASDNCPGVTTACVPPSGSSFPIGVTTVTCTATDASGNTATCSFTVSTFDLRLIDDTNQSIRALVNSFTGQYRFCCSGTTFTGVGKVIKQGDTYTLSHTPPDRRVTIRVAAGLSPPSGSASLQAPAGKTICTITDRDTRTPDLICQ